MAQAMGCHAYRAEFRMHASRPGTKSETPSDPPDPGGAAQIARLQRAIVKLAFSFHEQIPALGERLKSLGGLLKSGPRSPAVFRLIDDVVEQIVAANLRQSDAASAAQQLAELLSQLQMGGEDDAERRTLTRRLAATKEQADFDRLAHEIVNFLNRGLNTRPVSTEQEAGQAANIELLLKLLDSIRSEGEIKSALDNIRNRVGHARTLRTLLDTTEEIALLLSTGLHSDDPENPAKSIELGKLILLKLIEKLATGGIDDKAIDVVRGLIVAAVTPDDLRSTVTELADALIRIRRAHEHELEELGGFLTTVTRRLEEFKTNLRQSGYSHDDTITQALQMHQSLEDQMGRVREEVHQQSDLGTLKSFIGDELDEIGSALTTYIDTSKSRHMSARQHVSIALQRLNDIEQEMSQLKSDLSEQHSLSLIDALTGAYNRSGYADGISREYSRWQRHDHGLALAIVDLDRFKTINDQYGHVTGDKVLASVAAVLRKHLRASDLLCRYGGEEFVLILPETIRAAAQSVAEKLCMMVAASQFRFKDQPVPVTISCGVAAFRANDTIEEVFERADRALYRAKNEGRNRACIDDV